MRLATRQQHELARRQQAVTCRRGQRGLALEAVHGDLAGYPVLGEGFASAQDHAHALTGRAGRPWFLDEVDAHSRLDRMEQALRACTLWLWLDLRFPGIYGHVDEVQALRSLLNDGIERQLGGKRPLAQMRRGGRPGGGGGRPRA